jgi:hypothetical protein
MKDFAGQTMADDGGDEPTRLIAEIEAYCEAAGIKPSTFGQNALGDRDAIQRLRNFSGRLAAYRERIAAYISANPPKGADERGSA